MIELYILAGISAIVIGALVYAQILHYKNKLLMAENEIMKQTIRAADEALHQRINIEAEAFKVQRELNQRHKSEQAQIDQGDRSQFDTDSL